jgi:eukaryotic-like serine/threonine-protein kinase
VETDHERFTLNRALPKLAEQPPRMLARAAPLQSPRVQEEMRTLLHQRLAVIWPFSGLIFATALTIFLFGGTSLLAFPTAKPTAGPLLGLAVLVFTAGTAVLWRRAHVSLGWLRVVEISGLVAATAILCEMRVSGVRFGLAGSDGETDSWRYYLLGIMLYNTFGWVALILVEGIAVPGSLRRAAAYVFPLALLPLSIDLFFILAEPGAVALLAAAEIVAAQMLGFAVVMALFGSHKMDVLRREVGAARQAARIIGPYSLTRLLGAGGMGEVYLAEHRLLKRPCAVKLIRPDRAGDPGTLARFEREAQAAARLEHPNTVEVYDFGCSDDGTFYLVMEYLDGMSLDAIVSTYGPLPAGRVVYILLRLCAALSEAHAIGLIHRDIKPSNILLCRQAGQVDVVKLVDFGMVQVAPARGDEKLTKPGGFAGTPAYMSPEQAEGKDVDPRSDLYSLGATAFYLLTGKPPFDGRGTIDVLFAHLYQPAPFLRSLVPDAPADLENIVARCLAKPPAERFATADELRKALEYCTSNEQWSSNQARAWWSAVLEHTIPPAASDLEVKHHSSPAAELSSTLVGPAPPSPTEEAEG